MDPLEAVFVFCFVFGVATSLISLALGAFHGGDGGHGAGHGHGAIGGGHGHVGLGGGHGAGHGGEGHFGAGHGASHGGHLVGGGDHGDHGALHEGHFGEISPFNLQTITAFMAFFGGTGWVAYTSGGVAPALALIAATLAGFVGGGAVFMFLVKVLVAGQQFMDPADTQMEGTVGRVTMAIHEGAIGEIVFTHGGTRRSEGARSVDGAAIAKGTEVVIVRYEGGLAYVEPWSTFAGEA
ncbi:MAG: NfeD family protein [Chloroflexota bacterium]